MSIPIRFSRLMATTLGLLFMGPAANAAVFKFEDQPFAGSTALETPGRQIVGNERFIPDFYILEDKLAFDPQIFGISNGIQLFNGSADSVPGSGFNFIVLDTFDFDGDFSNGNQLNAGQAATLIANAVTQAGSGFFIYFNSGLDLPRLVFSTDLNSSAADLKVLARFTGLAGDTGRALLPEIGARNVGNVPEPASWAMMLTGFGLVGTIARRRKPGRAMA
jgi:hypothetical protein